MKMSESLTANHGVYKNNIPYTKLYKRGTIKIFIGLILVEVSIIVVFFENSCFRYDPCLVRFPV